MQRNLEKLRSIVSTPTAIFVIFVGVIIVGLAAAAVIVLNPQDSSSKSAEVMPSVVQTVGDAQVINVSAKGGFSPSIINASANKSTTLKVSTKDTYDCSNTLIIPSLKKQILLPPSGTAEIEIPAQKSGTSIHATCSMGMYNLELNFM